MLTFWFGLGVFVVAFLISLFLTPWAARLAVRKDALDRPTHRKRHGRVVPLWGGLSLWLSMIGTLVVTWVFSPSMRKLLVMKGGRFGWELAGFVAGSTLITAVGLLDDRRGIPPKLKLLGQAVAAAITVAAGIRVLGFVDPFFHQYREVPMIVGAVLAFFWIVLTINAMNFVDGLDGLASGIGLISALAFFLVAVSIGKVSVDWAKGSLNLAAWLSLTLSGGLAAFLLFNFFPARIFLGDSGSMFLGHALASIALIGSLKSAAVFATFLPILIMALPLADVLWAVVRRWREGQPISKADKGHMHHRLLDLGLSHRGVVLILYGLNGLFAGLAVWLSL